MNRATKNDSWVQNPDGTLGFTCSIITGCLKRCDYCFAMGLANGRLKQRYLANKNYPIYATGGMRIKLFTEPETDPFYPRFWQGRLEKLDKFLTSSQKPVGVFLNIMGEWAGDWIPRAWQDAQFEVIRKHPRHRFYLLTKQPQNLIKFSPFLNNCFVGVTVTTWDKLMETRFALHDIEAKVKFISFEPLLSEMRHLDCLERDINWLIIGAQTKPTVYPKDEWVQEIEQVADEAGIPVFEKNNLYPAGFHHLLRQEMPK